MKMYSTDSKKSKGHSLTQILLAILGIVLAIAFFIVERRADINMANSARESGKIASQHLEVSRVNAGTEERSLKVLTQINENLKRGASPDGSSSSQAGKPAAPTETANSGRADITKFHSGQVDPVDKKKRRKLW